MTLRLLDGDDADEAAVGAVVLEPDAAGDLGEERIVFTESHVETWPEAAATLPHEDCPPGHDVAGDAGDVIVVFSHAQ